MDRPDVFDPETYTSPMTIDSMIRLRAFCAEFFKENVRGNTEKATDEELLDKFTTLITTSRPIFARARAVIPELQVPPRQIELINPRIRRVLQLTEQLNGSPESGWSALPEDAVWARLTGDGQELREREADIQKRAGVGYGRQASSIDLPLRQDIPAHSGSRDVNEAKEHSQQPSNLNFPNFPYRPKQAVSGPEEAANQSSRETKAGSSIRVKPSAIATFVPRDQLDSIEQLVWSPTSGTRELRPDEIREKPGDDSHPSQLPPTRGQHDELRHPLIQRRLGETTNRPQFQGDSITHPPFQHQLDHMLLGAAKNPYLPLDLQRYPRTSIPPIHNEWPSVASSPARVGSIHQPLSQILPPLSRSDPFHGQQEQPYYPFQTRDQWPTLAIPAQGSLDLLQYWRLLYHRAQEIASRLSNSHQRMTPQQQRFMHELQEARIETVARANLPPRGTRSARNWLGWLENELEGMQMAIAREREREEEVGDEEQMRRGRMADYEVVLRRAMEVAWVEVHESRRGRGGRAGRGRGMQW